MGVNELSEFIDSQSLRNPKNGVVIFPATVEIIYGIENKTIDNIEVQVQEQGHSPNITFHKFNDINYPASYNIHFVLNIQYLYETYLLIEDTFKNKPLKVKVFPVR